MYQNFVTIRLSLYHFILSKETFLDDGLNTSTIVALVLVAIMSVIVVVIIPINCMLQRTRGQETRGDLEMDQIGESRPSRNPAPDPYLYADGFIHEDPNHPDNRLFPYDTIDDEEVYQTINDSDVVMSDDEEHCDIEQNGDEDDDNNNKGEEEGEEEEKEEEEGGGG